MGTIVTNGTVINNMRMTVGSIPPPPSNPSTGSIVTSNLALYWDASIIGSYPGSGSLVRDLSGNNKSGSLSGTYSSINGGTFNFNGTNQLLLPVDFYSYNPATYQFAFMNTGSFNDVVRGVFTTCGNSGARVGQYIGTAETGGGMQLGYNRGGLIQQAAIPGPWVTNTWYILTLTVASDSAKVYRNGNTTPILTVNATMVNFNALAVGTSNTSFGDKFWKGNVANFLIYNKILTTSEITQNYNALKTRFGLT